MSNTISLCCITAGPLSRVTAILELYRPVVDEIVCAVHGKFSLEEIESLKTVADRVVPCEMGDDFLQERYRPWLYSQCSGDWIVSTDSDEVPSTALLSELRALASKGDVVTYATTCRWLYPDGSHHLDEYPWEPAWKLVMVRNDAATLYLRGGVHEGVVLVEPFRYLDLPVYHLDCVITSYSRRTTKAAFYNELDGVQVMEDGRFVSDVYYLPEDHAKFPSKPLPAADAQLVREVLEIDVSDERILERDLPSLDERQWLSGTVPYNEILRSWPEHPLPPDAYRAKLSLRARSRTPHRDVGTFFVGEVRPMLVDVHNEGGEIWRRAGRNEIRLASRWYRKGSSPATAETVLEGPRSPFAADVHPGDDVIQPLEVCAPSESGSYLLLIDLVHEHVRWFDCAAELAVEVASSLP